MGKAVLFKRFLQHPTQVGALCPSSCALCRAMASEIGVENAGLVVELGPGTGVITRELVRRLPENGKLLAVELDELLSEGGYFATFAYLQGLMLPAGIRFRKLLNELFSEVTTSRVVWKNLPPALVYRCRK